MSNKTVSIILPIYNTREYLNQCLDSILNQTYRNIELICVDDGSTDGSSEIIDQYAKKDPRILVRHQVNQGESKSRNEALKLATGEYIVFCDCDDWIEADMYKTLVYAMEQDDLDMVAAGWFKDYYVDGVWQPTPVINEKEVTSDIFGNEELLRYLYERDSYRGFSYMWNKMYDRDILIDDEGNLFEFDEELALGGDVIMLARIALKAKRARYIDKPFYHYRMRNESGSHTSKLSSFRDWIRSYEITIGLYENKNINTDIIDLLKRFLAYHASEGAQIAIEQEDIEELAYFQGLMKSYYEIYSRLNNKHPEWINEYRQRMEAII